MNKYMISKILFGLSLFLSQTSFFNTNAMAPENEDIVMTPQDIVIDPLVHNLVRLPDRRFAVVTGNNFSIYNETGEREKDLGNGKKIVYGRDKKRLMIKEGDNYIACEGYDDLSDLQIAILLGEKNKVESLLSKNMSELTDSLVKFAIRYSNDKEIIETLEDLLNLRTRITMQELNKVLPVKELEDITLDYLDVPESKPEKLRRLTKQKVRAVLPIEGLQDISLDYLDMPRKK